MGLQKIILNIVLKIEVFFISFFKIHNNRITFISLEDDHLTSDFLKIYQQLPLEKYDVRLCLIHYKKNLGGQFLYFINCMKQLYYVYTSKIIFLHDNNYVVSHFKRKGVQIIQVWHACGAIKKFGNVIERQYPISNYDYVLATSSYWKEAYSQAFSVQQEQVLPVGMPRTDELFHQQWIDETKEKLYQKYPMLKNKKIILYAPTFRGNIYKGFSAIYFDAQKVMNQLSDDFVLIYKFHPLMGNYHLQKDNRILNMNHEDTHELFCISDYLISDYSSIVFDFMILKKPMLFYIPDYEQYCQDLGVFVDVRDLGYPVCYCEEDVVQSLQTYHVDEDLLQKMKNQFFEIQDGHSTLRVVELVEKLCEMENDINE